MIRPVLNAGAKLAVPGGRTNVVGLDGVLVATGEHGGEAKVPPVFVLARRGMSRFVTDRDPSPADLAMDRYARGDAGAFAELYDLLAPRLLGYLTRQTHDAARAEDLVQQTLLRIHRVRGRFLAGSAVVPWAMAIARRLFIDDLRLRKGDRLARSLEDEPSVDPPDLGPSATDFVVASELNARIQNELAKLPEAQRVAFELIKEEGLSLAEAAAVLGTTVTAVKLRAHRAHLALRRALGDLAPEMTTDAPSPHDKGRVWS